MARVLRMACIATLAITLAAAVSYSATVTVTIIAETRDESFKWQTEMIQRFEAAHPNIKVDVVSTAGSGLGPKMQTMRRCTSTSDSTIRTVVDWGKMGLHDLALRGQERQYRDWYPAALDLYRTETLCTVFPHLR